MSIQSSQTNPLIKVIGLVVLPHALHHQLHCANIWDFRMEVHLHEGCHSCQQARYLFQLLSSMVDAVCPCMINQENAAFHTGQTLNIKLNEAQHSYQK